MPSSLRVSRETYIRQEQNRRPKHHKLNVFQLMAIYNVCFGDGLEVKAATVDELVEEGIEENRRVLCKITIMKTRCKIR